MLGAALTAAALAGCPLFPADFTTNQRVDHLPVATSSDAIVRSIGLDDNVHADFGSGRWEGRAIGIPYGLIVADNGSDWFVSGAPDSRWDDDQLHALGGLSGRDFEVVDTGR